LNDERATPVAFRHQQFRGGIFVANAVVEQSDIDTRRNAYFRVYAENGESQWIGFVTTHRRKTIADQARGQSDIRPDVDKEIAMAIPGCPANHGFHVILVKTRDGRRDRDRIPAAQEQG